MIFRSSYPEVTIPEVSLSEFVLGPAAGRGDKPALIDGVSGQVLTYAGLAAAVNRAAAGLAAHGVRKGEVVALFSPNSPEYVVAVHAVATLGAVVTPVNPLYTAEELAFQLQDAAAAYLITTPALMERVGAAVRQAPVREIFVFGAAAGATPFATLLASAGPPPAVAIDPRTDLVALPYSSGTTGLPKGVMLTHYNLVANLSQMAALDPLGAGDTLVGVLPFFHIYGLVVIMNLGLHRGATIVTLPRFDLEAFLGVIQHYGVTRAHVVPPIVLALAQHPLVAQYDLHTLAVIMSAAAPLSVATARACVERLGCRIKQAYGLTEASPATHWSPDEAAKIKLGSVGVCVPNMECRIVDPLTGADLGPEAPGEIWVRGPQVMRGYLNQPAATAAMIDAAGWLHTGDIGYADAEGYFYIVDRIKELIKYKGYQIAPAELEALLLSHPAVADAAVIAIPDAEAGEVPKAFVVLKGAATDAELLAHVAAHVAPFKKIRAIERIEQIPKSASGKILRRLLIDRERAAAQS
ncbi:MAG TPA: AMP-binding protein [Chloroflexia bacterium]|nr:AMP-binding protein [Chloroflexia bacterium]